MPILAALFSRCRGPGADAPLLRDPPLQAELSDQNLPCINNSAQVLALVTSNKPDLFFTSQIGLLQKLIEKSVTSDETTLHESLRPILQRMFEVLPPPSDDADKPEVAELQSFQEWAENLIGEGLKGTGTLRGPLFVLQCWTKTRPDKIESVFAAPLVKILNKLCK